MKQVATAALFPKTSHPTVPMPNIATPTILIHLIIVIGAGVYHEDQFFQQPSTFIKRSIFARVQEARPGS
jgi:hypothetical protein